MEIQTKETFLSEDQLIDVVRALLEDSWKKKEKMVFYKDRNNYRLEVSGKSHPMWTINIFKKNEEFHYLDWKLKKDLARLRNLGKKKTKKLYLNDENKAELMALMGVMESNNFSLVYNDDYILFKTNDKVNIFKVAAHMYLKQKEDGFYLGEKRIL